MSDTIKLDSIPLNVQFFTLFCISCKSTMFYIMSAEQSSAVLVRIVFNIKRYVKSGRFNQPFSLCQHVLVWTSYTGITDWLRLKVMKWSTNRDKPTPHTSYAPRIIKTFAAKHFTGHSFMLLTANFVMWLSHILKHVTEIFSVRWQSDWSEFNILLKHKDMHRRYVCQMAAVVNCCENVWFCTGTEETMFSKDQHS